MFSKIVTAIQRDFTKIMMAYGARTEAFRQIAEAIHTESPSNQPVIDPASINTRQIVIMNDKQQLISKRFISEINGPYTVWANDHDSFTISVV